METDIPEKVVEAVFCGTRARLARSAGFHSTHLPNMNSAISVVIYLE
jgi:hypothetical protein